MTDFRATCLKFTQARPILSATKMYPREFRFSLYMIYWGACYLCSSWASCSCKQLINLQEIFVKAMTSKLSKINNKDQMVQHSTGCRWLQQSCRQTVASNTHFCSKVL